MKRTIRLHLRTDGKWTFQPIAENGEPQALSEPYASKGNARRGAASLFPADQLVYELDDDQRLPGL